MKPIETAYAGYKFRSRLEARWAVFFDVMRIKWEYEKEGYEINGAYYLPDFYLPEHDCWIEIKGEDPVVGPSYKKDYRDKRLLDFSYEKLLVVFWGVPGENDGYCFCHDSTHSSAGEILWCEMKWCESSGKPAITTMDSRDREYFYGTDWKPTRFIVQGHDASFPYIIEYACECGRRARFEHGESNGNGWR
jgi:hypothetical protein